MKQPLPYKRTDRVGHQVIRILGEIAARHIDLSHLGFITFTGVQVAPDLRYARIYYSVINPQMEIDKITDELNQKVKAFKKYLAPELPLKNLPDLRFFYDGSLDYMEKISTIIQDIDIPEEIEDTENE